MIDIGKKNGTKLCPIWLKMHKFNKRKKFSWILYHETKIF